MELRHLRYFVAVADAGSLTVAAARKLHTSQPSLSRQIRDLEDEVGAQLLTRSAHGIELTPAGRAFLDHARLVLSHAEAAAGAARRIANPAKPCFVMGFLTGHELTWMPEALQVSRDELPNIDVMISSQYSPQLADALSKGKVDAAFLRREQGMPDLAFKLLVKEPLVVILPNDHRLAALKSISPRDLMGEAFVAVSDTAPVLRAVIDDYPKAVRSRYHASSPGGPPRYGNVPNRFNARWAVTGLRRELSRFISNKSSPQGRHTDGRSGAWLQKVEQISDPEVITFKIGRTDCARLEEAQSAAVQSRC